MSSRLKERERESVLTLKQNVSHDGKNLHFLETAKVSAREKKRDDDQEEEEDKETPTLRGGI